MARKNGALPSQTIKDVIRAGCIHNACEANVQPASIDLTLSHEVYRMRGSVLPRRGESVKSLIERFGFPYTANFFECGAVYLIRLRERLELVPDIYGTVNPKSTTGRLDMHVRLVVDGSPRLDVVPHGYKGELWLYVISHSFSIRADEGTPLAQLRLFNADTRFGQVETTLAMREYQLLWSHEGTPYSADDIKITDNDGMCILTLDTECSPVGWRARHSSPLINMAEHGVYDRSEFFEPVEARGGYVYLDKGFYIFSTRELVRIPPILACEMQPTDDRSGEFRAHYAGFIDPGWAWGANGEGKGRPLTLEVRPFEKLLVGKGRPIAKIGFERMAEVSETLYDTGTPNYRIQSGPRLAKQFKQG